MSEEFLTLADKIHDAKNPADLRNAIAEYRDRVVELLKGLLGVMVGHLEIHGPQLRRVVTAIDALHNADEP